jgi:hypothetical protein
MFKKKLFPVQNIVSPRPPITNKTAKKITNFFELLSKESHPGALEVNNGVVENQGRAVREPWSISLELQNHRGSS